jgi:hypothetical protein
MLHHTALEAVDLEALGELSRLTLAHDAVVWRFMRDMPAPVNGVRSASPCME